MPDLKNKFPIFKSQKKLVYFDNASTSQVCKDSLDAMNGYLLKYRANVHRGVYDIAEKTTKEYESSRISIANFIGAEPDEIIFTSGTTHGLNALAYSLGPRLSHRDNIVLSRLEHHANLVPWQQMAKHYGFQIRFIELTKDFNLDVSSSKKLIDANTKIVSFALVSNVLGCITPTKEIIDIAKTYKCTTIIDAAQAAAHVPIDVKQLDCDFLVFSGHKMYGPNGIGVLYGKKDLLKENLEPFFFGGEMVSHVTYQSASWNEIPHKFEAGTPNIVGAIGLGAAAGFLNKIGWNNIKKHELELTKYAIHQLKNEVLIFGSIDTNDRIGVISFTVPSIHPHDLASLLNEKHIAVRAGFHCAEPLHQLYEVNGTARISFGLYNSKKEIDQTVKAIKDIKKIFKA